MAVAKGIAAEKMISVHGIVFRLVQMEDRWPGQGDIFALRQRAGMWHEEFCGFSSFSDAEEQLRTDDRVADMAGFLSTEAPKDRPIQAVGFVAWREEECGGQYPFAGVVRWLVLEGWSGWVYASDNLAVSEGINDTVRVTRWKEV